MKMKLHELLGYFLFFELTFYEISTEFIPNSSHTIQKSAPSNVTWIKLVTFDPKEEPSCENCTIGDYDDHSLNQRPKRRKRRRHKKPIVDRDDRKWSQRRTSSENSHKKYSTRVRLDRPVQFLTDFNQEHSAIPKTDVETTFVRVKTTTQTVKNIPPPVRYLLPPFVDQYFAGNSVTSNLARKKPTQYDLPPHQRGLTKFKNTVYYKDDGIDIISNEIYQSTTPLVQSTELSLTDVVRPSRPLFKPIVVPPVIGDIENTTSSHLPQRETSSFLAPEVAKAGMKIVNMNSQLLQERHAQSNPKDLEPVRFPQLRTEFVEKTSTIPNDERTYQDEYRWHNRFQVPSSTTQNYEQVQQQPYNQRIPQPNDEDVSQRNQQTISYRQILSERMQKTTVPQLPDDYAQTDQRYNQLSQQNYRPGTRQLNASTTPVSKEYTTNSTVQTIKEKTNNFRGLELAESNYFSGLPTQEEVSSLVQNGDQVIPGTAGKDYPIFSQTLLQKRRFACRGLEGYFADISSRCQVFYICNGVGAGEPMLCPNGTLFSQELLVCDWWYNVDC